MCDFGAHIPHRLTPHDGNHLLERRDALLI